MFQFYICLKLLLNLSEPNYFKRTFINDKFFSKCLFKIKKIYNYSAHNSRYNKLNNKVVLNIIFIIKFISFYFICVRQTFFEIHKAKLIN